MDNVRLYVSPNGLPALECSSLLTKDEEQSIEDFIDGIRKLERNHLINKIKEIRDRESNYGDYDYYYGVDALLEELGEE